MGKNKWRAIMKADSRPHHVIAGSDVSGEGESVTARGGEGICAGHYGVVAWNPAIILVDGYFHDIRPNRNERYTLRVSVDDRCYAVCDVDVTKPSSGSGSRPDRVDIPTLALYVPTRPIEQTQDAHWEQPDMDRPYDLRWELRDVGDEPMLKMFLSYRVIPI
jgi:hypothetical protein